MINNSTRLIGLATAYITDYQVMNQLEDASVSVRYKGDMKWYVVSTIDGRRDIFEGVARSVCLSLLKLYGAEVSNETIGTFLGDKSLDTEDDPIDE